jgi:hypothetical protein
MAKSNSSGKAVLDASDVFHSRGKAIVTGLQRGERAIYGFKEQADRPLARRAVK